MSIVSTAAGGKISGLLALTFETDVSLPKDTPVHVVDDYEVAAADGTKIVVGYVDVSNVRRVGGSFPVYETPGVVTVEARGYAVRKLTAGGSVTAGDGVKVNSSQKVVGGATPDDAGYIGVALTSASTDEALDVLVQ